MPIPVFAAGLLASGASNILGSIVGGIQRRRTMADQRRMIDELSKSEEPDYEIPGGVTSAYTRLQNMALDPYTESDVMRNQIEGNMSRYLNFLKQSGNPSDIPGAAAQYAGAGMRQLQQLTASEAAQRRGAQSNLANFEATTLAPYQMKEYEIDRDNWLADKAAESSLRYALAANKDEQMRHIGQAIATGGGQALGQTQDFLANRRQYESGFQSMQMEDLQNQLNAGQISQEEYDLGVGQLGTEARQRWRAMARGDFSQQPTTMERVGGAQDFSGGVNAPQMGAASQPVGAGGMAPWNIYGQQQSAIDPQVIAQVIQMLQSGQLSGISQPPIPRLYQPR